jgi:hypothetical protein
MLDGHVDLRMELDLADAMGSCSTYDAEASVGAPASSSTSANDWGALSSSSRARHAPQSSAFALACAPIVVKRQWGGRPALHRRSGRPGGGRGVRRFGDSGRDCVAADVAADVVSDMMTNIFHKLLGQSGAHAIETHLDADCLSLSLVCPCRRHPQALLNFLVVHALAATPKPHPLLQRSTLAAPLRADPLPHPTPSTAGDPGRRRRLATRRAAHLR